MFKIDPPEDIMASLIEISNKARKGGLLSIEGDIQATSDPYLAQALQMTVDGVKTADIAAIMQKKMALTKKGLDTGSDMFSSMGAYAPAFGMIGTLIGLVQMLSAMDDPKSIGPAMAVALLTTLYGAMLANMVALPIADKLTLRKTEEGRMKAMCIDGVLAIQEGQNPRIIESMLKTYLEPKKRAESNALEQGEAATA